MKKAPRKALFYWLYLVAEAVDFANSVTRRRRQKKYQSRLECPGFVTR